MTKAIDYYFWINSDWAYLGHGRLVELAKRQGAAINYMPVDLPYVYSQTGAFCSGSALRKGRLTGSPNSPVGASG
ncbi:hypothetical protein D9M68_131270 [compost metagenome]